jgi:hypothetical protein
MQIIFNINNYLFKKKEKKYFVIVFIGIIITTILEIISIASIIPVFNIIILEQLPLNFFFDLDKIKFDINFKLLTLSIFIIIFVLY